MDANQRKAMKGIIKTTLKNLEENGFETAFVNDRNELLTLIKTLIPENASTASGGSETLLETGILEYLKTKTNYTEDSRKAFVSEYYLASANALTIHGEIYEVDARGNRVGKLSRG